MSDVIGEVDRFRRWADGRDRDEDFWESDYGFWPDIAGAALGLCGARPFSSWSPDEVDSVLYMIARDYGYMPEFIPDLARSYPRLLLPLAAAAAERGEADAKAALAHELGAVLLGDPEQERLLFLMLKDGSAGVRNAALESLARLGHPETERLAREFWDGPDPGQEAARVIALYCLYNIGSPLLPAYLGAARLDGREVLAFGADLIRSGRQAKWAGPVRG